MPTGYTAGIENGTITTFEEYALICMRAFGATMHLRDESLDCEYEPRKVSNFYEEQLKKLEDEYTQFLKKSDDEIIHEYKEKLIKNETYYLNEIINKTNLKIKYENILNDVRNYQVPTEEHVEFKKFMETQLVDTINWDCDIDYCENELNNIKENFNNIDVDKIKKDKIKNLEKDISYYQSEKESEIKRVDNSNKWCIDLFESLKEKNDKI